VVRDYISNSFGSEYRTGVYSLLSSLGFHYQKAKGFYPERNGQAEGEAKADKKTLDECSVDLEAVVLFEDEFSLSNTVTLSHTCALVGEQREIPSMRVVFMLWLSTTPALSNRYFFAVSGIHLSRKFSCISSNVPSSSLWEK
jgi:hypothetical protein